MPRTVPSSFNDNNDDDNANDHDNNDDDNADNDNDDPDGTEVIEDTDGDGGDLSAAGADTFWSEH